VLRPLAAPRNRLPLRRVARAARPSGVFASLICSARKRSIHGPFISLPQPRCPGGCFNFEARSPTARYRVLAACRAKHCSARLRSDSSVLKAAKVGWGRGKGFPSPALQCAGGTHCTPTVYFFFSFLSFYVFFLITIIIGFDMGCLYGW